MSLLSDYHKELGIKKVIESDHGFLVYYFVLPDECYLEDVYVIPEKRKSGLCFQMFDQAAKQAKDLGCKYLTGSIIPSSNNAESSAQMQLKYGFRFLRKGPNVIYMIKDL